MLSKITRALALVAAMTLTMAVPGCGDSKKKDVETGAVGTEAKPQAGGAKQPVAPPDPAAPRTDNARITALIADLDDTSKRDAAVDALSKSGPGAVPLLAMDLLKQCAKMASPAAGTRKKPSPEAEGFMLRAQVTAKVLLTLGEQGEAAVEKLLGHASSTPSVLSKAKACQPR